MTNTDSKWPTRFERVQVLPDGSSVFSAPHEIWNDVRLTFPPHYFDEDIPEWVEIDSFVVFSNLRPR